MGKRKPRRKAPPRAAPLKLEEEFDCPFCSSIKSVQVLMRRKDRLAALSCRECLVSYEMAITALDEPVDVYSCWIDSCEEVNMPAAAAVNPGSSRAFIPQVNSTHLPPRPPQQAVNNNTKRRRVDTSRRDEFASDAELEREAEEEDALEEEETYTAEDDDEEEEPYVEDEEPAIETEPADEPRGRTGGRLQKKSAWASDDESA